jgi:isopentenyl-diphosphate delta-isomerase
MTDPLRQQVAAAFADWGLPTAEALVLARQTAPDATLFASGGIRDGMDVAKALALGANLAGLAGPFLRAAADGEDACNAFAEALIEVLRTVMFATGAKDLTAFREKARLTQI